MFLFPNQTVAPYEKTIEPAQATTTKAITYRQPNVDPAPYKAMLREIASAKGLPDHKVIEIEHTIGGDGINKTCPNGESNWYTLAVGDNGDSIGIVQINLPSHPEITRAQAEDAGFSLNFIVDEFLKGNEWKWTCWKAIYSTTPPLPHSAG